MSDRDKVERVVCEWAALAKIPNTQASLCNVWLAGPNATSAPCDEAFEDLIERLRKTFPDRGLDLQPRDFEGTIRHVDDLVVYVMVRPVVNAIGRTIFAAASADPHPSTDAPRSIEAVFASFGSNPSLFAPSVGQRPAVESAPSQAPPTASALRHAAPKAKAAAKKTPSRSGTPNKKPSGRRSRRRTR